MCVSTVMSPSSLQIISSTSTQPETTASATSTPSIYEGHSGSTGESGWIEWIVWLVGVWQFIKIGIKLIRLYKKDSAAWEEIFPGLADDVDCLRRLARDVKSFFSEEKNVSPRKRIRTISRWHRG